VRLTDKDLGNYVTNKIALPGEDRNEFRQQVNRLLDKLAGVLAEDGSYRVKMFRRAGSLEKGTSNRPRAGKAVDADVGVYFDVDDTSNFDIGALQRLIKKLLAESPYGIVSLGRRTAATRRVRLSSGADHGRRRRFPSQPLGP